MRMTKGSWILLRMTMLVCAVTLGFANAGAVQSPDTGTLAGRVLDETGAAIPQATVTLTDSQGNVRTIVADSFGAFRVENLAPGRYTLQSTSPGFTMVEALSVEVAAGQSKTLNPTLRIAPVKEEVTVESDPSGQVSVDPQNNVGAVVLRGEDLEALSDDPDDLAAELQALAGPAAGPNGGQIFVDGFSGARIPPKSSIREIRINADPFSAQYDRLGFGRIEILTRPGTDKFRGQASFGFSDESLNSRNPFAANQPSYQSRLFSGSLSGPISKKSSFFIDLQRREIDDNDIINATILDTNLAPVPFSEAVVTPSRRTTVSPRIDYQLSEKVTLTGRYRYFRNTRANVGVGEFSLLSLGYDTLSEGHTIQLSETALLSPQAVNETRLQFRRNNSTQNGDNSIPTTSVLQAFRDGGPQVGLSSDRDDNWELQNYTTLSKGVHTLKFGARLRATTITDISPQNFGGTFTFGGGFGPMLDDNNQVVLDGSGQAIMIPLTSIERYRRTVLFQAQGLTPAQIRSLGGGATQFSLAAGDPDASVDQVDVGLFLLDDWRVRPNFSLSLGLRYETQNNISDRSNWAPRIGFAWAPGRNTGGNGRTVIRGGFGIFYDRLSENLTLQTLRFDGVTQLQFIVQNPDFYPLVPSPDTLIGNLVPQTIRALDPDAQAPYLIQTAIGIERALGVNTTVAVNYTYSRGVNLLRNRNINAPLPETGLRPFGDENVFRYETSGLLRQNQLITSFRTRFHRNASLFGFYSLNRARSDTDGASSFPANQFDLSSEYGRSSFDLRHRFVLGGSITAPFGFSFSPFVTANSGRPFNITTGTDTNGDLVFTDRPSFADLDDPDAVVTRFGVFDPTPEPGENLIPRNLGEGPSHFSVNLRINRTFGFGKVGGEQAEQTPRESRRGGIMVGGGRGGRGGGGGGRRGGGGFGGRRGGRFGGGSENRFSLNFSVSINNIFNRTNAGRPIGNLTSPLFGLSNSSSGFGRGGSSAGNRTVTAQLRFSF